MQWLGTRIGRVLAVVALLVLAAAGVWAYAIGWAPATRKYPIQGVDVSEAQGDIDWTTLHARGATFAYLRATVGATVRDGTFEHNWAVVTAIGLPRGAIHVWSFCQAAAAQANNFVTVVPRDSEALPAVLELAFSPDCAARPDRATLIAQLQRFLTVAERHTGKPMLLKITKPVERAYRISAVIPRPVWEAANFFPPDYAARPWRLWQASDMRRVDGVRGPVEWDVVAP